MSRNLSATALRLRQDAETLDELAEVTTDVAALKVLPAPIQSRVLGKLLISFGVKEPEAEHLELLRKVVYSENPSAYAAFPGDILIGRKYDTLVKLEELPPLGIHSLRCPGETLIPELGCKVICRALTEDGEGMKVRLGENPVIRSRAEGDTIRLSGGTKTLKKLFIDKKIPASERSRIPVLADDAGVAAVWGIGPDCDRKKDPNWEILLVTL